LSYKFKNILQAIICLSGIYLFALFIHRNSFYLISAFVGLIISAFSISLAINKNEHFLDILGLYKLKSRSIYFTGIAILFGVFLGLAYNYFNKFDLIPKQLTQFALTATLIGIFEEVIFRGFIYNRFKVINHIVAIICSAFAHSIYKFLVLKTFPYDLGINFVQLFFLTFIVGILFGLLRKLSKNVIPPAVAHACFDILVYGASISSPVWVWA